MTLYSLSTNIGRVATKRFLKKVAQGLPFDCWPWLASKNKDGYGNFRWRGKIYGAHVISFMASGRNPFDFPEILHTCNNPSCCNPNHLTGGTHEQNMQEVQTIQVRQKGSETRRARYGGGVSRTKTGYIVRYKVNQQAKSMGAFSSKERAELVNARIRAYANELKIRINPFECTNLFLEELQHFARGCL